MTEVPVPTDFGLTYDDLKLRTSDNIHIRAYLLLQKKEISQGTRVDVSDNETDEEVRSLLVVFNKF
jgi:hypothetical protein